MKVFIILNFVFIDFFLIFFIIFFCVELVVFFFSNKERYIKLINIFTLSSKIIYLILGLFNIFIYWITALLLFIYIYFLHLKFKYLKRYDSIQLINYIFLFVFALLTSILIYHNFITFIGLISSIVLSILRWPTYIINKKKALKFRSNAIEAFNDKNYDDAKLFLVKGIDYAGKMIYIPHTSGYLVSDLQKLMEKEKLKIQKYIDDDYLKQKNILEGYKDDFKIPKVSRKDLRKYVIRLFLLSLLLYPIISLFLQL